MTLFAPDMPVATRKSWPLTPLLFAVTMFFLAFAARAANIAQYVTTDEDLTLARSGDFAEALTERRWARTYQIGHPEVTVMWVATLALTPSWAEEFSDTINTESGNTGERGATDVPSFLAALAKARLVLASVHSTLIALIGLLLWRLAGARAGVIAGAFLAVEPFLVAHGQLLRADALVAELSLVTLLAAIAYWRAGAGPWSLLVASVTFGLGLLTKTPIVLVGPVVLVIALSSTRRWAFAAWGLASLAIAIACWPALWERPVETVQRVIEYTTLKGGAPMDAGSYLLGTASLDPGPLFYPVALLLRLSPVALAGILALVWWRGGQSRSLALILVAALAVVGLALTVAPKKADRYIIPAIPIVVTLAGLGVAEMARRGGQIWRVVIPGICLVVLVWSLISVRPYPLSYYNPLLGGGAAASQLLLVGWGEGLDQVADYLNRQADAPNQTAAVIYPDSLDAQFTGQAVPLTAYDLADVAVRYIAADQRGLTPPTLDAALEHASPELEVVINGIRYARVYRLPSPTFAGGITLDSATLSDQSVPRDTPVRLRLRWSDQSLSTERWRTRLIWMRPDGQPVGEVYGAWREPGEAATREERITFQSPRSLGRYSIAFGLQREGDLASLDVIQVPVGAEVFRSYLILPSLWFRVQ
jgi:4-amino-4-deoxy-L-arabinose transferase-like glycosyltransferase